MESVFLKLVNMSITASYLIIAVILFRLVLKKAPKSIRCVLWGLVALRLVCPFSFESVLSLIPNSEPLPEEFLYAATPQINTGISSVNNALNPIIAESLTPAELTSANPTQIWSFILSRVWVIGMIVMALYAVFSYLRLRRRVAAFVPVGKNIRLCDRISSPFILGILQPKIYLPSDISQKTADHVLAHEMAHIARKDHWWKPLGYLLLTVYWFNPFIWAAYILLCRDIELACDERVVKTLDLEEKKAYSSALLRCSVPRRMIAACPLAFGEVGVKNRIKSVLNYKKPAFWIVVIAVIASIVVGVCFLTDPAGKPLLDIAEGTSADTQSVTIVISDRSYEISTADDIAQVEAFLEEVRVSKSEISQSRSEDRDQTNSIIFHCETNDKSYHFNADFTEVWYNNQVKPSMTYAVKNSAQVSAFFDGFDPLRSIKNEDGYTILNQEYQSIGITVPKSILPDSIYSAEGHEFGIGEVIVYQTDTTTFYLKSVRFSNEGDDKLYFKFNSVYTVPDYGTVTLLYRVTGENETEHALTVSDKTIYSGSGEYANAVSMRGSSQGGSFEVYVDTEVCKNAADYLYFTVENFTDLSYAKDDIEYIPPGTYDIGTLAGQNLALSYRPEEGDGQIILSDNTLTVIADDGTLVYAGSSPVLTSGNWSDISNHLVQEENLALFVGFISSMEEIVSMHIYEFMEGGEPRYTIYCTQGKPCLIYDGHRLYVLEQIDTSNRLAPGTYVPVECVYMNPASSYYPGDLSDDYRYTVTAEGFYTDGTYPYCNANVDEVDWGWKSMKDCAEDLKFFLNWMTGDYAGLSNMQMPISSDALYQKLDAQTHLLLEDGNLYILHGGEARNDIEAVWAIYRLEAESVTALKKGNDIVIPFTIEELTTLSGLSVVDLNPSTTAELVAIKQYGDTVLVLFRSDGELILACYEKTANGTYTRTQVLTQSELQPTDFGLVWYAYVEATGRKLGVLICLNENVTAVRYLNSGSSLTVLEQSPALIELEFAEPNWSDISADYEFLFGEIPTFPYPSSQNSYIAGSQVVVYDDTQRPGYYNQSTSEIEMLMKILRDVPEESVQEGLVVEEYCVNVLLTCLDSGTDTNPEPLYIELRYAQDAVDLIIHDNTYWPSIAEGDLTYHIRDKVLNAYMDSLAGSSKISYTGIIDHHWLDVSEYSHE